MKNENNIEYIYKGRNILIWKGEKYITFHYSHYSEQGGIAFTIPLEFWEKFRDEIMELASDLLKEKGTSKENESEDIKAFRKEIEIRLLEVIDDYRVNWNKELAEKIEKMEEKIEDHHEKFYPECHRCCEVIARNQTIKDILELLK